MKKSGSDAGSQLLFLMRQKRYLYHQLKLLTERQLDSGTSKTPEFILDIISGRRKLIEKIRQLEVKLQPIRNNREKFYEQIDAKQRAELNRTENQIRQITSKTGEIEPAEESMMPKQ